MDPMVVQGPPAPPWFWRIPPERLHQVHTLSLDALLVWLNQESQARGLVSGSGNPLRFVPQAHLPPDTAYESWIAETGCVPTRDNLHDRYNAMMWLCAPKTKARLNHVQAAQLLIRGRAGARGAARDAATLWDENLLVLVCTREAERLFDLLSLADWPALFVAHRNCWHRDWQPMAFGHALLEKLQHPYKAITAHCVVIAAAAADWEAVDAQLAELVSAQLAPRALHPLPVMGIPGWHPENTSPAFYQDAAVFRPRRRP